jgi:predicted O-methyltransferase YrrM
MKNLNQIYNDAVSQYGAGSGEMVTVFSDKGTMHSYIDVYEKYFSVKRSNASLLEIGMMTGGSMYLWQQYFKKYQLTGMDLSPRWNTERPFQTLLQNDPNISLLFGVNSRTKPVPAEVADQKFDFVIDDGDHSVLAQMDTFQNYWPMVKAGGVYFIEDVVGPVQAEALKKFLSRYPGLTVDHYAGLKNNRADDQIIIVTKLND